MRRAMSVGGLAVGLALSSGCSSGSSGGAAGPAPLTSSPPASSASPRGPVSTSPSQRPVPPESNPPGDIPDNLAFVPYVSSSGHYRFVHPEGWAEAVHGTGVLLTDKLNGVQAQPGSDTSPPTVAGARSRDVPTLQRTQPAFELRRVTQVTEPGGAGVLIVYRRNSQPDPVTGRQYRDEVLRYEIVSHGRELVLELFGPVGADNVDAYRTMIQSARLA